MTTSTGNCKIGWPLGRNLKTSCPEQEDFGSFAGRTRGAAREEEAVYGKDEASDLTAKQKEALKNAIEIEVRARQAAKLAKQRKRRR